MTENPLRPVTSDERPAPRKRDRDILGAVVSVAAFAGGVLALHRHMLFLGGFLFFTSGAMTMVTILPRQIQRATMRGMKTGLERALEQREWREGTVTRRPEDR